MDWKKAIPHLVAIIVMAVVAALYCSPVLQGKMLAQDDTIKSISQSKESKDYREETGEEALWTTRVFSGMTIFHIGLVVSTNVTTYVKSMLLDWLPKTVNIIFATMLGFYLLQIIMGVNPWLALVLSLGYGLSSNLIVSLLAGHNTKVLSIGFLAPAIGGLILGLNGKKYLGAFVTVLSLSMLIISNHYQIMYYYLLIALSIGAVYLFYAVNEKTVAELLKNAGLLVAAGLIALLPNIGKVYNTYEHSAETIRGKKSELTASNQGGENAKGTGLDKEYAMRWSYGPLETFTLVVPSFMGGATGEALPENGNVEESLKRYNLTRQQKESILSRAPVYVGEQPFLLGTVYFGAGFIFLFILALFLFKGRTRAWVITVIVVSLVISWGRHFDIITGLLFDYFPMYNKFRTPSMALAIAGLAIPLFGALGLQRILSKEIDNIDFQKAFKMAFYITGGMMVLLLLYGLMNDWIGPNDGQYQTKNSPWGIDEVYEALLADRKGRYLSDWFISTVIMAITAGLIWFYQKGKTSIAIVVVALGVIFTGDMWRVSKRYLDNDDFITQREWDAKFAPSPADLAILQDKDPHYRVLNATLNPWTDGQTCYFHENVGGHHAAKLRRYQDLIENELSAQLQNLNKGLMQADQRILLNPEMAKQMPVYNMLNTKYFIIQENNPGGAALNQAACGNAWFVEEIKQVNSADAEMSSLANFDPLKTAVIHSDFSEELYNYNFGKSANASIKLEEITPKYLKYSSSNDQDGLAVFSEVYYPDGWEAFIDGQPADIYRANYILRTIKIPAGDHTIEMKFDPASYHVGKNLSLAGSLIFALFAAGMLFLYFKKREE